MYSDEWEILLQTNENNIFTLTVYATSEGMAKNKAKKFGDGCRILATKQKEIQAHGVYRAL